MNTSSGLRGFDLDFGVGLVLYASSSCWRICGRRGPRASITNNIAQGDFSCSAERPSPGGARRRRCHLLLPDRRWPRRRRSQKSSPSRSIGSSGRRPRRLLGGRSTRVTTRQGLDVTLENSKGSGDVIASRHRRAVRAFADAAVVIASAARGTTVKTVGHGVRQDAAKLFSLKSQSAHSPRTSEGARRSVRLCRGDSQR